MVFGKKKKKQKPGKPVDDSGTAEDTGESTGGGRKPSQGGKTTDAEGSASSSSKGRELPPRSGRKFKKAKTSDPEGETGSPSSSDEESTDIDKGRRKKKRSKVKSQELRQAEKTLIGTGEGTTEGETTAGSGVPTDTDSDDGGGGDGGGGDGDKVKKDRDFTGLDVDDALRRALHDVDERKKQVLSVRIHIIEAKELEGNNLYPLCKVTIDNKTHSTFVKTATNNPKWDQSLSFNMKCSIEELCNMKIAFKVFSARKMRSDSLIGCHSCDLGMIYKLPNHCLVNRWLVLTLDEFDPDLQGYLKVWVCIVLPGVLPPTYAPGKPTEDTADKALWPSSIMFRPVQVLVRIFSLENLAVPKKGGVKKLLEWFKSKASKKFRECEDINKVCPFVEVQVGSYKLRTETKFLDSNPIYNQELRFQVKWPPVSRVINMQVYDRQVVGMTNVPLAHVKLQLDTISRSGESGFLPTIGPCCISLCGSYDDAKPSIRKKTNRGILPPTAFQGRAFIEIRSYEMEEEEPAEVYDVPVLETELASDYVVNNQFLHLFVCSFLTCSMIPKPYHKQQVYFQVSFGHAGDTWRVRGSKMRHVARTEARHPLRGERSPYFYMPWNNQKPTVLLTHKLEHQPWRFDSSNFFTNLADKVAAMIASTRQLNGEFEPRMASEAMKIIETITEHLAGYVCFYPTTLHKVTMTELDYRLVMYRQKWSAHLLKEVFALKDERIKAHEALEILESVVRRLNDLAVDPQLLSYPDIYIWMVTGGKRVGYAKVNAKDVFYSPSEFCRGKQCGKHQSIVIRRLDHVPKETANNVIAHIHVQMFLALVTFYDRLEEFLDEGSLQYFTEVYETKPISEGGKQKTGKKRIPEISDEFGKVDILGTIETGMSWRVGLRPPRGFDWVNDWLLDNYLETWVGDSKVYEKILEEVYELQARSPQGPWESSIFVNQQSEETGRPTAPAAKGHQWLEEKWRIERTAVTDCDGWEYSIARDFSQSMNNEQHFHKFRRRLLVRAAGYQKETPVGKPHERHEDWMYGKNLSEPMRFTLTAAATIKRRRWRRRMRLTEEGGGARVQSEGSVDQFGELFEGLDQTYHKLLVYYPTVYAWQLRAYIYQARDLVPYGRNNLPDPQVRVTFTLRTLATMVMKENINPIWDRTLVFSTVYLNCSPAQLKKYPFSLALEVWDESRTKSELMGQCFVAPQVRPEADNSAIPEENAKLAWHTIILNGHPRGQVLAAFELYQEDSANLVPQLPPEVGADVEKSYMLPCGIKPNYKPAIIDLLCLGVRRLAKFQMSSVKAPFVEVYLGKARMSTEPVRNAKEKPNFERPFMLLEAQIPTDMYYMTPLTICLFDSRSFGRKPLAGTCMIRDFSRYARSNPSSFWNKRDLDTSKPQQIVSTTTVRNIDDDFDMTDIDWWAKFHAASKEVKSNKNYKASGLPMLKLYSGPLEEMERFENFTDFCDTFTFYKAKKGKKFAEADATPVGELKGNIHIYSEPGPDLRNQLESRHEFDRKWLQMVECLVRVYVIDAKGLASQNARGTADPYIEIKCGKQRASGRSKFVAKSLSPTFGQVYELTVQIPQEKDLEIKVRDKNAITADDDIGQTTIDLENRLLSQWRATCGLPEQYCIDGPCRWRDIQTPRQILNSYTERYGLPRPIFLSDTVAQLGKYEFDLELLEAESVTGTGKSTKSGDAKTKRKVQQSRLLGPKHERLALCMLHYLDLVPEHVETRTLRASHAPGLSQGNIRLWVDIFPTTLGAIPPPVDIKPREPEALQLRLVIYSARHVARPVRIFGVQSSDVYVKAWIQGMESKAQTTDVHYSCIDGEADFNWRMVFDFEYLFAEDVLVCKTREKFWQIAKRKEKVDPVLIVQVFDNNKFKRDRFLGQCTFNMLDFEPPESRYDKMDNVTLPDYNFGESVTNSCTMCCACCIDREISQPPMYYVKTFKPKISMFKTERNRGWWPVIYKTPSGKCQVTAKLDMEYSLITKQEADEYPVGKGRNKPNEDPQLLKPDRGADSYWLSSKAKGLCRWLCRKHKGTICMCVLVSTLLIMALVLITRWPEIVKFFSGKL